MTFLSCSEDSSGPGDLEDLGEATLSVSGDIEANHTGQADFLSMQFSGVNNWEIHMHDFNPQTFSMTIFLTSLDEVGPPGTGTFEFDEIEGFSVIYEYIENEDLQNAREFSNVFCDDSENGTFTISSSSDSEIRGSFNATISEYELNDSGQCENLGTVNITGNFRATPMIGL
jgi:hypothetical protein